MTGAPAERESGWTERLARPRIEREGIAVIGNETVLEAERSTNVVVHPSTSRELVVRKPVRGAALIARLVLGQLDLKVHCATDEHPPHRARLLAA